jgi:chromatin segregation and condensation protein Rec8/ScpA/Scc1 (kleisin family)
MINSVDFATLIQHLDHLILNTEINAEIKNSYVQRCRTLKLGGNLIYHSAEAILEQVSAYLEQELNRSPQPEEVTFIDQNFELFLNSLTQQNLSIDFLDNLLIKFQRQAYVKNQPPELLAPIKDLTASVESEILDLVPQDFTEEESPTTWYKLLEPILQQYSEGISLVALTSLSQLSIAEVFLGLFLNSQAKLQFRQTEFYADIIIKLIP